LVPLGFALRYPLNISFSINLMHFTSPATLQINRAL
jgi:hypothetical protein